MENNYAKRMGVLLGILLLTGPQHQLWAEAGDMCWQKNNGRGAGFTPNACPAGTEQDKTGLLCYPKCQPGFNGVGPVCWSNSLPLQSYGRSAGLIKDGCQDDKENSAGLCYQKCETGMRGVGPACWGNCGGQFPIACGAGCAKSVDACATSIASQVIAPLDMLANIGLTILTGGAVPVLKATIKATLTSATKAVGKELSNAALESAAKTMAEANLTGKFNPSNLDPTGIAAIVDAYNYPVCDHASWTPQAPVPPQFRVIPAGVAGGTPREGNQCEVGAFFNPVTGKCAETCFGTAAHAGRAILRKDSHYCDYGVESPMFQPDTIDRSKLGSACGASFGEAGLFCNNGKATEICHGTSDLGAIAVPRNANGSCNYGATQPVKVSQAPLTFGGQTQAYGLDPNAVGKNVVALIGGRWAFAGIGITLDQISAGSDGALWGIDPNYKIYTWNGQSWLSIPGTLSQIAVGNSANIWGLNAEKKIFPWTGKDWEQVRGELTSIAVGADGDVWGLNAGNIWHMEDGVWVQKPGVLTSISAGRAASVWGSNQQGLVYRWNGTGWDQVQAPAFLSVHAGGSGSVWGVTPGTPKQRQVYRWAGKEWVKIEAGSAVVAPL